MKAKLILIGVLLIAFLSCSAQTNEPIVQVKFYSDPDRTNKVHLFSIPEPTRWIVCSIIGIFKSGRMQVMIQGNLDSSDFGKLIIFQNYPGASALAIDDVITISGRQIGTITGVNKDGSDMNGYVLQLWEYVDVDSENRKARAELYRQTQIQNEIIAKNRKIHYEIIQSNAVKWLKSQATNGDAGVECSLALHYLNGQGCETNREQAIYWLQKSAAQGNSEASNKLFTLQK